MALSNFYWDQSLPPAGLLIADIPQAFNYVIANTEAILDNEHDTFPTSSNTGCYHSAGSAKIFVGAYNGDLSSITRPNTEALTSADYGRLAYDTTLDELYIYTASGWIKFAMVLQNGSPNLVLQNTTHEDTEGGRESTIRFKGEQSGGEVTTLATIVASHEGTSDDQKGKISMAVNDGNDSDTPSKTFLSVASTGAVTVPISLTLAAGATITELSTDGTLADNSDTAVPTEKAVKTAIDTKENDISSSAVVGIFGQKSAVDTADDALAVGTVYQAACDGFLMIGYNQDQTGVTIVSVKSDGSNPPSTLIGVIDVNQYTDQGCITIPIIKNRYVKMAYESGSTAPDFIFWQPFGTGGLAPV